MGPAFMGPGSRWLGVSGSGRRNRLDEAFMPELASGRNDNVPTFSATRRKPQKEAQMPTKSAPRSLPAPRPTLRNGVARRIGMLIYDNFQLLDAAGPVSAFEMPAVELKPPPYAMHIIAPIEEAGPVRSTSGASMYAEP